MNRPHTLRLLESRFAIARLNPDAAVPAWVDGEITCVARTSAELSVLCAEAVVPEAVRSSDGWRCIEVVGPLEFEEIGVLSSLTGALAEARISVFAVSTFDTDYLLVRADRLGSAVAALERAGYHVDRAGVG